MRLVEYFISFCKEFNQFNNTRAPMIYSIYYRISKLLKSEKSRFCHLKSNVIMDVIT